MPSLQEMYNVIKERISPQVDVPPSIILSQVIQESGWDFDSALNRETNNFSGLTQTSPNAFPQPDGQNYYKQYASVEEWADDYVNSFMRFYEGIGGQRTPYDYAAALKANGYFGAPLEEYAGNMESIHRTLLGKLGVADGMESYNLSNQMSFAQNAQSTWIADEQIQQQEITEMGPATRWAQFVEGAQAELESSILTGPFRTLVANTWYAQAPFGAKAPVTDKDIEYVSAALPGDEEAQRWVLMNGRDSEAIRYLTQKKIEERKLKERVSSYGFFSVATLGQMAGGFFNPMNYIPMGIGARSAGILAKLGGSVTNMERISKYARIYGAMSAKAGAVNMADTYLSNQFYGNKTSAQELAMSGLAGVLLSAGGAALGGVNVWRGGKPESMRVMSKFEKFEDDLVKQASGVSEAIRNETRAAVEALHDSSFVKQTGNAVLEKLVKNKRMYVVSRADIQKYAQSIGKSLPDDVDAFNIPNESYSVLIKDNIKDPKRIDGLIKHEIIHDGMRAAVGDKAYKRLMRQVTEQMDKKGSPFHKARQLANGYDPEEVFAVAVQHGLLGKGLKRQTLDIMQGALRKRGIDTKFTEKEMLDFVSEALQVDQERTKGFYRNADQSTTWAGIRFSRDNMASPDLFAKFIREEELVAAGTQKDLPGWARGVGKLAENSWFFRTPLGAGVNSLSNTFRKYAPCLFRDVRGRNFGLGTIPAEDMKTAIQGELNVHLKNFYDTRASWIYRKLKEDKAIRSFQEFDKQVTEAFNSKYAGNKANVLGSYDNEVWQAVEYVKALRDAELEIGKNSASRFGLLKELNLIEDGWEALDHELWRIVDNEMLMQYIHSFTDGYKGAHAALTKYYKVAAKRDIIAAKIKRSIEKENKNLPKGAEPKATDVTEDMIDAYLSEHIPAAVDAMLAGLGKKTAASLEGSGVLGRPRFLKHRIPLDTTVVMRLPNGKDFSFDNNLRSFDLGTIMERNVNRFAGEIALRNTFGTHANMKKVLQSVKDELNVAVRDGRIDAAQKAKEVKILEDSVHELWGKRSSQEPKDRIESVARIFQNLSYYRNGARMTFAQVGEICGVMAYSGFKGVLSAFGPLRKIVEDAQFGKITAENVRDAEFFLAGETLEKTIFERNFGDRMVRDALTADNLTNRMIRGSADAVANLGKITSYVNRLAHMTDNMVRYVRNATITDSIRWAHGETFSKFRNPFSHAKLQAAGIRQADVDGIKRAIHKYLPLDAGGKLGKHRLTDWMKEDPVSYWKWRALVMNQADRAVTPGRTIGNRNILKDANWLTKLVFQYKDFSFRTANAQVMRALTSRDFDDAMAMGLSVVTNAAALAARYGAIYASYKAMGADDIAEKYWEENLSVERLALGGVLRSTLMAPLSVGTDIAESGLGTQSFRTTVDGPASGRPVNSAGDFVGNVLDRLPGVKAGTDIGEGIKGLFNLITDEGTKRDLRRFLQALPLPNLIPWTEAMNAISHESDLPDKRPSKKGGN